MCLLFSGIRMGFPRLFFQNGHLGLESIARKEPKIILCIFVTTQYSEAHIFFFSFFFMISRNSSGFISLCPDFFDMALGRPAHGLQTLLDVGPLCYFQQSAGKPYILVTDGTHVC